MSLLEPDLELRIATIPFAAIAAETLAGAERGCNARPPDGSEHS